jgi:hypothetical protein
MAASSSATTVWEGGPEDEGNLEIGVDATLAA